MVARLFGHDRDAARMAADAVLDQMGLTDAGDRLVRTYSGGMQRRLDLGRQPRRRAPAAPARRADHRSRPAQPQRAVGRDRGAGGERHRRAAHHPVPRRSRPPRRHHRDHRPRQARGVRHRRRAQVAARPRRRRRAASSTRPTSSAPPRRSGPRRRSTPSTHACRSPSRAGPTTSSPRCRRSARPTSRSTTSRCAVPRSTTCSSPSPVTPPSEADDRVGDDERPTARSKEGQCMTAITAPDPHRDAGPTTAFTVGGRTTCKLLRTPQVFGIADRAERRVPADVPLRPRRRDRRERRHLRRVPRPRVRRVRPPLHRRRRRRSRSPRTSRRAQYDRLRSLPISDQRRARRSGDGRRRAHGAGRARDARRRLHHRLPHEHARSPDCRRSRSVLLVVYALAFAFVFVVARARERQRAGGAGAQHPRGAVLVHLERVRAHRHDAGRRSQAFAKAQPLTFMVNSWRGLLLGDAVTRTFDHDLSYYVVGLVALVARDRRSSSRRSRCAPTASARSRANHSDIGDVVLCDRTRPMRTRR